eukprot:m.141629 g.141629  ORF g.141629 m.141629 type:complete len:278 (+) comp16133_c0_seq1:4355-5188(+)
MESNRRYLIKRIRPIPKQVLEIIARLESRAGRTRRHAIGDPTLTEVHISGLVVTEVGFRRLGEAIAKNAYIKHLIMPDCYLTESGALALFEGIARNNSLVSINLGENTLTEISASAFIQLLQNKPNIADVYLDWGATNQSMKCQIHTLLSNRDRGKDGVHHSGFRGSRKDTATPTARSPTIASYCTKRSKVPKAKRGLFPPSAAASPVKDISLKPTVPAKVASSKPRTAVAPKHRVVVASTRSRTRRHARRELLQLAEGSMYERVKARRRAAQMGVV